MNKLLIVMYHYVRNISGSRYSGVKGLEYNLFKEQVKYLKEKFNPVTMEEVIAYYNESYELPDNAVLLTFDDGYIDHYTNVFPILNENGIQGSFFIPGKTFREYKLLDVNKIHFILAKGREDEILNKLFQRMNYYRGGEYCFSSNQELYEEYAISNRFDTKDTIFIKRILQTVLPEKLRNIISSELFEEFVGVSETTFAKELYCNYDQLNMMKRCGMYMGIHGYDHYWLNNLCESQLEKDINYALESMDGIISPKSWVMCYPYGSSSTQVVNQIKQKGCKLGLTTEVNYCDASSDKYLLGRFDTNDFPPKSSKYLEFL